MIALCANPVQIPLALALDPYIYATMKNTHLLTLLSTVTQGATGVTDISPCKVARVSISAQSVYISALIVKGHPLTVTRYFL
jgi:hypothetical protein